MKRLFVLPLAAFCTVAVARAEPIVAFDSRSNLDYAKVSCLFFKKAVPPSQAKSAAVLDCQMASDTRLLGRRLEYEIESKFAVDTRCKGVTVLRMNHPDLDGIYDDVTSLSKSHWNLMLYYHPGSSIHSWALVRSDNAFKVNGEGTPAQIADEACIVVTGQSANIP